MRTEYLIYFRPETNSLGTAPAWYYVATSRANRTEALRNGGIDVSDNDADWRAWEHEQNIAYMHG